MRNKLLAFFAAVWILAALPLTAAAQQFDHSRTGSISVTLVSQHTGYPMEGAELSVFYVATVGINTDGKMNYILTEEFKEAGFLLDDAALVSKLDEFVSEDTVSAQKIVTDSQGNAVCEDLPLGLYFVKQTGEVSGFAPCTSFLVTVPMETAEGYQYDVNASPKTDVVRLTDITIKKVWNTGNFSEIPRSVTVQLLRGDKVVETATLNRQNNWQITYTDMPESDRYSIKEVKVPKGFTATYSKRGYVFTVTNTPALAQTGQVIWPIPVFALSGMFFLMIGFMLLRKQGKQDA